jgi:hypothetical protein
VRHATALLVAILSLINLYTADATAPSPCTVAVEHDGDDPFGSRLALALRERIESSPLYQLGDAKTAPLLISVASVRIRDSADRAIGCAFYVHYLLKVDGCTASVRHEQITCTHVPLGSSTLGWLNAANSLTSEAEDILSGLDKAIEDSGLSVCRR